MKGYQFDNLINAYDQEVKNASLSVSQIIHTDRSLVIDTESQSKRKHVYNPRLVKCPQQHGDIVSVCPVCIPWNDETFKTGAKIEICQSKTFVNARRCLMMKRHFDAESALLIKNNKYIK